MAVATGPRQAFGASLAKDWRSSSRGQVRMRASSRGGRGSQPVDAPGNRPQIGKGANSGPVINPGRMRAPCASSDDERRWQLEAILKRDPAPCQIELVPERSQEPTLRVGLLGCGVVGSPVARALLDPRALEGLGLSLELARVAVRHPDKERPVQLPRDIVTTDALAVAIDPEIDIVVELMGGIDPALGAILGIVV